MTFPTTAVIDDFGRADGNLNTRLACSNGVDSWFLGKINGGSDTNFDILSGRLADNAVTGDSFIQASFGPDTEVYLTMPVVPTSYAFLAARIKDENTATWDGYGVIWIAGGSPNWQLRRYDNGSQTNVSNTNGANPNAGDKIGLSVVGSLLTGYLFTGGVWTTVLTGTDATYPLAGKIGIEIGDSTGRYDDFGGGTVVTTVGQIGTIRVDRGGSRRTSW